MSTRLASPLVTTSDQGFIQLDNEAYTLDVRDREVITGPTAMSAARALTLAAASAVPKGVRVRFCDVAGVLGAANTWTITRAGTDTIGAAGTTKVLNAAFASCTLMSDGVSKWSVVIDS